MKANTYWGVRTIACWWMIALFCVQSSLKAQVENKIRVNDPVLLQTQSGYLEIDWLQERRWGDSVASALYRDPSLVQDAVLHEFIAQITKRLLNAALQIGAITPIASEYMAWQWLLFRDPEINAFAAPGGYIGINLGLIAHARFPDEVAAVLAHELSHVTQRHLARSVIDQQQTTPLMLASVLLGGLAASNDVELGSAILATGQGLGVQRALNFSRDMEREADRIGFNILVAAGYAGSGFQTFFETLQSANRINDQGEFPYLRTHPLTNQRIADIANRVQNQPTHNRLDTPSVDYTFIAARAGLLSDTSSDNLYRLQQIPKSAGFMDWNTIRQAQGLYAAALAAMWLHDEATAQRHLQMLQRNEAVTESVAAQRLLRLLKAEVALAFNQTQVAQNVLKPLLQPLQRPELLLLVQAQVQQGRVAPMLVSELQTLTTHNPEDIVAWHWLEKIYALQDNHLRALEAQTQIRVAQLDYDGAIDRLLAAQDWLRAKDQLNAQERVQQAIIRSQLKKYIAARRDQRAFEAKLP